MFCCCNVVGAAIYLNKKLYLKIDRGIIFRDVSFYIAATLVILGFGIYGEINLTTALVFLGLYVMQVATVLIQQCKQASKSSLIELGVNF